MKPIDIQTTFCNTINSFRSIKIVLSGTNANATSHQMSVDKNRMRKLRAFFVLLLLFDTQFGILNSLIFLKVCDNLIIKLERMTRRITFFLVKRIVFNVCRRIADNCRRIETSQLFGMILTLDNCWFFRSHGSWRKIFLKWNRKRYFVLWCAF